MEDVTAAAEGPVTPAGEPGTTGVPLWWLIDAGDVVAASEQVLSRPWPPATDATSDDHWAEACHHAAGRLWKGWLLQVHDPEVVVVARQVLSARVDHQHVTVAAALGAARLRTWLAISLLHGPDGGEVAVLDEARTLMRAAAAVAARLGDSSTAADALTWLALLSSVIDDDPAGAATACRTARAEATRAAAAGRHPREELWDLVLTAVEQWSAFFSGRSLDPFALDRLRTALEAAGHGPLTRIAVTTALVAAAAERMDLPAARGLSRRLLRDPDITGLGLWRRRILYADGFFAVVSGDRRRVEEVVAEMSEQQALAEAAMIRATQCLAEGHDAEGRSLLRPVIARAVTPMPGLYAVACALQALFLERAGASAAADAALAQAIAYAEALDARRLFFSVDGVTMARLLERAAAAPGRIPFVADVAEILAADLAAMAAFGSPGPPGEGSPEAPPLVVHPEPAGVLTPRELDVLRLASRGADQRRIAEELFLSLNTIKTHLRSVRTKLGVERTSEAAAIARAAGWIDG